MLWIKEISASPGKLVGDSQGKSKTNLLSGTDFIRQGEGKNMAHLVHHACAWWCATRHFRQKISTPYRGTTEVCAEFAIAGGQEQARDPFRCLHDPRRRENAMIEVGPEEKFPPWAFSPLAPQSSTARYRRGRPEIAMRRKSEPHRTTGGGGHRNNSAGHSIDHIDARPTTELRTGRARPPCSRG